MDIIIPIVSAIAALVIGFFIGTLYRKKIAEAEIGGAEEKAKSIIEEATKLADNKKKEALLDQLAHLIQQEKQSKTLCIDPIGIDTSERITIPSEICAFFTPVHGKGLRKFLNPF